MAPRVAEHVVRGRLFGPNRLLRVDLHGVSEFGAGDERTLLRWEWIEAVEVERGSVVVKSAEGSITMPSGAFGMDAAELGAELERARAIHNRSDVIARLSIDSGDEEEAE